MTTTFSFPYSIDLLYSVLLPNLGCFICLLLSNRTLLHSSSLPNEQAKPAIRDTRGLASSVSFVAP
jgi:hypothetical protein